MKAKKNIAIAIIILLVIFVIAAITINVRKKQQPALTDANSVAVYFVKTVNDEFDVFPVRRKTGIKSYAFKFFAEK